MPSMRGGVSHRLVFFRNVPYMKSSMNSTHLSSVGSMPGSFRRLSGKLIFHGRVKTVGSSNVDRPRYARQIALSFRVARVVQVLRVDLQPVNGWRTNTRLGPAG